MVSAAHKEGIAVCRSASRHAGTQRTAGAAPIVDNHALLELLSKLMRQRSGKRIGAATCWERNANSDGPIGPCRLSGTGHIQCGTGPRGGYTKTILHELSPLILI